MSSTPQQNPWKQPEEKNVSLMQKMEIPVFNGEDAETWVLRVEQWGCVRKRKAQSSEDVFHRPHSDLVLVGAEP